MGTSVPRASANSVRKGFAALAAILLALSGQSLKADSGAVRLKPQVPYRSVAVLASEIGRHTSSNEIIRFARKCGLNAVVIDFSWITFQWPRTDVDAVRDFAIRLQKADVTVMMMYRPRVMYPGEAPLHYAQDPSGKIALSQNELCLAHEDSVAWAVEWGNRLRCAIPSVHQIVLYNLRPTCRCTDCGNGGSEKHVRAFLIRCRTAWARPDSPVQIGHVGISDEYVDALDFFCPLLAVNRSCDDEPPNYVPTIDRLTKLKACHPDKPMIPLLKVCWEEQTRNTAEDIVEAVKACDDAHMGSILWYYEWIFDPSEPRYRLDESAARSQGDIPCDSISSSHGHPEFARCIGQITSICTPTHGGSDASNR